VAFRLYLAERDVYVRSTAALVFALRRRLARAGHADRRVTAGIAMLLGHAGQFASTVSAGRRAARELWGLTRNRRFRGPNERIVEKDADRLRALRRWILRAAADPAKLTTASPVCGAWQLRFDVLVSRPALQRIVVECRGPDGAWRLLHARMALEFRAEAARPTTDIRREFSVPVPGPQSALRIGVRGIGRVGVSHVELTDGVAILSPMGWKAASRRMLGNPAARKGFPLIDWERNTGATEVFFRQRRQPFAAVGAAGAGVGPKKSGPALAGPL
jgi:hypothetical protein